MPEYEWRNVETGEVVTVTRSMADSSSPPDDSGEWERVYSFGIGRTEGGGGSPARPSVRRKGVR